VPIDRAEHKENFTQILNNLLSDERLSYGARGLMAYALTHYDDWIFTGENYFVTDKNKLVRVKSYLKELIDYGYLKRYQEKSNKGTFGSILYIFKESPLLEKPLTDLPITENQITEESKVKSEVQPIVDLPLTDLPLTVSPLAEKLTLNNTNITNINKKEKGYSKTDIDKIIDSYTDNDNLKEVVKDFIKMRKAIKKVMTDKALTLILKKLDKLSADDNTKIEILNQSIVNSWQGVFPLRIESQQEAACTSDKPRERMIET
jgi:hypothetical protein